MSSASEEFIKQLIKDKYPNIDLSSNSPFYDLFVRFPANTYLEEALALMNDFAFNYSLSNTFIEPDFYDGLLKNWFFKRIESFNSIVQVDIVFKTANPISFTTNDIFLINNNIYKPSFNYNFQEKDYFRFYVQQELKYKVTITLVSANAGIDSAAGLFNNVIPQKELKDFEFAQVTGLQQIGKDKESNLDAFLRLQREFGIRNLINKRSIIAKFSELFPNLVNFMYVAGFQEPEQFRDTISVSLPAYYVRLYFEEPKNLNLPKTTKFIHTNTNKEYTLKNAITVNDTSQEWLVDANTATVYIQAELVPTSITDLPKWTLDMPFKCTALESIPKYITTKSHIKNAKEVEIRIGGHTDIYVSVPVERKQVSIFVPTNTNGIVPVPEYLKPILKIHKVERVENGLTIPVNIYNLTNVNPATRYTSKDSADFFILPDALGINVLMDVSCAPSLKTLQNYVDQDSERILGENILVRYYNPIFVEVTIVLNNDIYEESIKLQTTSYFYELVPGSDLSLDHYIKYLMTKIPDLVLSKDQVVFSAEQFFVDGSSELLDLEEIITPLENSELYTTKNNVIFLLDNIIFEYV